MSVAVGWCARIAPRIMAVPMSPVGLVAEPWLWLWARCQEGAVTLSTAMSELGCFLRWVLSSVMMSVMYSAGGGRRSPGLVMRLRLRGVFVLVMVMIAVVRDPGSIPIVVGCVMVVCFVGKMVWK